MKSLNRQQIELIKNELDDQGITFEPLKSDLLDHLICDIEILMEEGMGFNAAMQSVKSDIPENHFKKLELETMKILNNKINLTRMFGYFSLFLLVIASFFKIMHLAGAGVLLMAFLLMASITLVTGSVRGIQLYQESKGRGVIVVWTFLVLVFIASAIFRILHLPGAGVLMIFSALSFCILLPILSIYFYKSSQKLKDHLLIKLIEENQHILEKTVLVLIGFGLIFNYSTLLIEGLNFVGVMYFVLSIILTGMYIYTLTWKYYVENSTHAAGTKVSLLIFSTLAFIMFMLPTIGGVFPYVVRQLFVALPIVIFITIVAVNYIKLSTYRYKNGLAIISLLLLFYPILKLAIKLSWFGESLSGLLTNQVFILGFLVVLIGLLIGFWKQHLFRLLIILMIAAHMIPSM